MDMAAVDDSGDLVLRRVEYVGSHPSAPNELSRIDVAFAADGVTFTRKSEQLGAISWRDMDGMQAFSATMPASVSFPAVAILGIGAFATRSRRRRVFLRVSDKTGDWVFDVPGIKASELQAGLAQIRKRNGL